MVPMEAAVMPFPRLETTPPVIKTNFGNGSPRGFLGVYQRLVRLAMVEAKLCTD
jgi:hypothetical protein